LYITGLSIFESKKTITFTDCIVANVRPWRSGHT